MNLTIMSKTETYAVATIEADGHLLAEIDLSKTNKENVHINDTNAVRIRFKEKNSKKENVLLSLFGFIFMRIAEESFEEEMLEYGFWNDFDGFIDTILLCTNEEDKDQEVVISYEQKRLLYDVKAEFNVGVPEFPNSCPVDYRYEVDQEKYWELFEEKWKSNICYSELFFLVIPLIIGGVLKVPFMYLLIWCAVVIPFLLYNVKNYKNQKGFWQTALADIEKILEKKKF